MNYIKKKENDLDEELNKMSFDELIYLYFNPHSFIYNKLKPLMEQLKEKNRNIQSMYEDLEKNKNSEVKIELKNSLIFNIKQLLYEKKQFQSQSKEEVRALLINELDKYDTPENCFKRFKDKKINFEQFEEQFKRLGKDKNYYYYKLIYDKLKDD